MTEPTTQSREPWHLDRKVPLALIFAIICQTLAAGVLIGDLRTSLGQTVERVAKLEHFDAMQISSERIAIERLARIETNINNIDKTLARVDAAIDRLATQRPQNGTR